MKLHELERALGDVSGFESPVLELEQYPTSPHLAAQVLFTMHSTFDDVSGKMICDLGCGTGMLAIASAIMGAQCVVAVDIDEHALNTAVRNVHKMEVEETVDFLRADATADDHIAFKNTGKNFDTIIMNPPFGTKRKGVDIAFLRTAVMLADHAVYSMHKSSTRQYIQKIATSYWGVKAEVRSCLSAAFPSTPLALLMKPFFSHFFSAVISRLFCTTSSFRFLQSLNSMSDACTIFTDHQQ